jgi:hypothetical protein
MSRHIALLALAFAAALLSPAAQSKGSEHSEEMMKCAKICAECQVICDSCFKHCLNLIGETQKEHAKTAQLCVDCAECCKACATLCARESLLARPMLECCEKCCKQCAEACEKHENDEHIAKCAKICRDCAKQCAEMLQKMGK